MEIAECIEDYYALYAPEVPHLMTFADAVVMRFYDEHQEMKNVFPDIEMHDTDWSQILLDTIDMILELDLFIIDDAHYILINLPTKRVW